MESTNDLLLGFVSPCGKYALTFEDDGKVAYAYLKEENRIVGDVLVIQPVSNSRGS